MFHPHLLSFSEFGRFAGSSFATAAFELRLLGVWRSEYEEDDMYSHSQ